MINNCISLTHLTDVGVLLLPVVVHMPRPHSKRKTVDREKLYRYLAGNCTVQCLPNGKRAHGQKEKLQRPYHEQFSLAVSVLHIVSKVDRSAAFDLIGASDLWPTLLRELRS